VLDQRKTEAMVVEDEAGKLFAFRSKAGPLKVAEWRYVIMRGHALMQNIAAQLHTGRLGGTTSVTW
jgi:hypothetical protein